MRDLMRHSQVMLCIGNLPTCIVSPPIRPALPHYKPLYCKTACLQCPIPSAPTTASPLSKSFPFPILQATKLAPYVGPPFTTILSKVDKYSMKRSFASSLSSQASYRVRYLSIDPPVYLAKLTTSLDSSPSSKILRQVTNCTAAARFGANMSAHTHLKIRIPYSDCGSARPQTASKVFLCAS